MPKVSKTLVIQPLQGIGDYMWFVRHLHAIAAQTPQKKIILLTRPRSQADLLSAADFYIEKVLWLDVKPGKHAGPRGLMRLANMLRPYRFREAWILHSRSLRYPVACRLAGIPMVYGPGMGGQKYLLSKSATFLNMTEQKQHPIVRGTRLIERHGLKFLDENTPLCVGAGFEKIVKEEFGHLPLPWRALCISSSETAKKWPTSYFIELGSRLFKAWPGSVFILGGSVEAAEGMEIQGALQQQGWPAVFVTGDLRRTLALVRQCEFVVGNDTGVTHSAPMMGSKGLVLLGQTQVPIHYYAPLEGLRAAKTDQVMQGPNNLEEITPTQVMEKLRDLGWILNPVHTIPYHIPAHLFQ